MSFTVATASVDGTIEQAEIQHVKQAIIAVIMERNCLDFMFDITFNMKISMGGACAKLKNIHLDVD